MNFFTLKSTNNGKNRLPTYVFLIQKNEPIHADEWAQIILSSKKSGS